jgi:hypothetical protein
MVDLSPQSVFLAFSSFVLAILITGLAFEDARHPMRSNESVVSRRIRQSTLVLLLVALIAIHIIWIWTGELYLLMLGLTEFTGLVAEVCIHAFERRVANSIDKLVLACFRGFSIHARPLEHSRYDRNNAPALWSFRGKTIVRYTCFPRKPRVPCNNDRRSWFPCVPSQEGSSRRHNEDCLLLVFVRSHGYPHRSSVYWVRVALSPHGARILLRK